MTQVDIYLVLKRMPLNYYVSRDLLTQVMMIQDKMSNSISVNRCLQKMVKYNVLKSVNGKRHTQKKYYCLNTAEDMPVVYVRKLDDLLLCLSKGGVL